MTLEKLGRNIFRGIGVFFCFIALLPAAGNAAMYPIAADVAQQQGPWNRFYEELISTDHMVTMLHSYYGRNMQNALRKASTECGFRYFRGHGILNSDIGLYSEPNGVVTLNWSKFDSVYDAAMALKIRPIIEFSFTPGAMAKGISTCLWYNNSPGNISMPKDLNKWRDLCDSIVRHCEARWGAAEVRKWFFEVYNEPNLGNFFAGLQPDYFNLYDYAAEGVRRADSLCRVGGPAVAAIDGIPWIDAFLKHVTTGTNAATGGVGSKCDFLSYHRYASDPPAFVGDASGESDPKSESDYHKRVVATCKQNNYKGLIVNNEWGPSAYMLVNRENEVDASFVVKTLHMLISNGPDYPPPYMYGFWCISDIYEEYNAWQTIRITAFDTPGNFGLCVRGDPNIPDSWDLGKPPYNAFRMLHLMGDVQISCTGGTFGNGVNAFATMSRDSTMVQVLVYNHTSTYNADSVNLTVSNIPFSSARVEHYIIDSSRSNTYRTWVSLRKPVVPTAAQWATLKSAEALAYDDPIKTVALSGNAYTETFTQRKYSISLILISDPARIAVLEPARSQSIVFNGIDARIQNNTLMFTVPRAGNYSVSLFNANGARIFQTGISGKTGVCALPKIRGGTCILRCAGNGRSWVTKLVLCK